MKIKYAALITSAIFAGFVSFAQAATTYDATSEFSIANGNPNGVWSYGEMDSGLTTFTAFTQTKDKAQNSGSDEWLDSSIDSVIWLNSSGSTAYGVPNGDLSLSPGNGGQAVVLRWTAPTGVSSAHVSGQFLSGDSGSESLEIFTGYGDTRTTLWSGTDSGSFDLNLSVIPGEAINFANKGPYNDGNTPISVTIQAVPEPSTVFLLIVAGLLFAVTFRRRLCKA